MAIMLRISDSVGIHLMKANRHKRFCYQVSGAQKYAGTIEPFYDNLEEKNKIYRDEMYTRLHTQDIMTMRNSQLDDGVRTVYEKCKQYDRMNPNGTVLLQIFPNETFGGFVRNNIFEESAIVEQIVVRLEKLGKGHPLFAEIEPLQKLIREMEKSIQKLFNAKRQEKIAKTEMELAKADLRKQYEGNYLDARKELGKKAASQLFPSKSYKKMEVESEQTDKVKEASAQLV